MEFLSKISLDALIGISKLLAKKGIKKLENNPEVIAILNRFGIAFPIDSFKNLYLHTLMKFSLEISNVEFVEIFKIPSVIDAFIKERRKEKGVFVQELDYVLITNPTIAKYPKLKEFSKVPRDIIDKFNQIYDSLVQEIKTPKEIDLNQILDKHYDALIDIQTKVSKSDIGHSIKTISSYENLIDICNNQIDWEFENFIGSSYNDSFYISRDFDNMLERTINPWEGIAVKRDDKVLLSIIYKNNFDTFYTLLEQNRLNDLISSLNNFNSILIKSNSGIDIKAKIDEIKCIKDKYNGNPDLTNKLKIEIVKLSNIKLSTKHNPLEKQFEEAILDKDISKLKLVLHDYQHEKDNIKTYKNIIKPVTNTKELSYFLHLSLINKSFSPFVQEAEFIINILKNKHIIITADGGKGKTYSICHAIKQLSSRTPIIFISAKNCYIDFDNDIISNSLEILKKANSFQAKNKPLFDEIVTNLKQDEQLVIVFDGIDFRSNVKTMTKWLMRLKIDSQKIPIRFILSTRREYWPLIKQAYEGFDQYLLFSKEIKDFSEYEFDHLKTKFNNIENKTEFSGFYDKRLLRNPSIIGTIVESTHNLSLEKELLVCDVYESYFNNIVSKVNSETQINNWYCELFIDTFLDIILEFIIKKEYQYTGSVNRQDIIKLCIEKIGEFHPEILQFLCDYGLLMTHKTKIWFSSDVLFDYLLAKRIISRFWGGEYLDNNFFFVFDLRIDWLSNKIGVMLFVSLLLTKNSYKLWEFIEYDFMSSNEYYNQLIYYLPTNFISPKIIKKQFSLNINYIKKLQYDYELKILEQKETYPLNHNTTYSIDIISFVSKLEKTNLNIEPKNNQRILQDINLQNLENEAIYWLDIFGEKAVPLIGINNVPKQTKRLLIQAVTSFCLTDFIPIDLACKVYLEYLDAAAKMQIKLEDIEIATILMSDDMEGNLLYYKAVLSKLNKYKNLGYINFICESDTLDTVKLLKNRRISTFTTDISKPEISGLDLVRMARDIYGSELKIIIMSAYVMQDDIEKGIEVGADKYLTLPVESAELLSNVICYSCKDKFHMNALKDKFHELLKDKKVLTN